MLLVDMCKQQTLAQIVLQATLHTIFEICHPILLFGTILLLNLCDLPPYTLIWHYTFISIKLVVEETASAVLRVTRKAEFRVLTVLSTF